MIKTIFGLLSTALIVSPLSAEPLKCYLHVNAISLGSEPHEVIFTVANVSHDEVTILPWYTPLEGFWSDLFIITNVDGRAIDYLGPQAKRVTPTAEDFITLAPDQILNETLNLKVAYTLAPGHYNLRFRAQNNAWGCMHSLSQQSWAFQVDGKNASNVQAN
ncbi:hypothetical protein ACFOEE_03300 [Pseudoalteromonas fenneropenaei]|uniref:Protease n=1 Tax=Pseudoalteromonas fenneropenaei TaxID=1737459 RepID=A0ABV7CG12_9GAMM